MLDKNILSQLSQLKADIQASKEYATGTVAGTSGRFGFVRLEDGRDAFLSPEKMQRVISGDKVKVSLTENAKGQLEAVLEGLVEQSLNRFLGQYKTSAKGHFVVPLGNTPGLKSAPINRWIFIPPKFRGQSKDGDMVVAKLMQHPYKDGRASAKVLERIGQENDPFIERSYTAAKYDLVPRLNESAKKQTTAIEKTFSNELPSDNRADLTAIPFVTIDSASTRDMDDALALEKTTEDGKTIYQMTVAIADPSSFIGQNSALAQSAQRSGQSLYLLGGVIGMLPESLANGSFSLQEGAVRPALVCHQTYNEAGELTEFKFEKALIKSQHKLSYRDVAELLSGADAPALASLPDTIKQMLNEMAALAEIRCAYRKEHYLVGDDQQEYDLHLADNGKIERITPRNRTLAHQIVEEAMLATNICAGEFLSKTGGLYSTHSGFREDRLGEVKALLKEEEIEHGDLQTEEGYKQLIKDLAAKEDKRHLIAPLRRMMPTAELSLKAEPHMGMGLHGYATVTSPIRRFADLYNHWALGKILNDEAFKPLNEDALLQLKESINNGRQADRELYQWLICQFVQDHLIGAECSAKIRIVTQQGFGARLDDNGIDGFILFPKKAEKTFDAKRMTLQVADKTYSLDQEVQVKVDSVDMNKRRIAFSIIEK